MITNIFASSSKYQLQNYLFNVKLDKLLNDGIEKKIAERIACRKFAPPITKMELFLTENCTFHCDYCFAATKNASLRMSLKTAEKAIDFLINESRDSKSVEVIFFGGEPLMEFKMMEHIADYAEYVASDRGKSVTYALTTNGSIMSEEIISFAKKYNFNYLLSIDGDANTHDRHRRKHDRTGTWNLVTGSNFRLLKKKQGWVGTRMTVMPDTAENLSHNVKTLFTMGINQFLIGQNMDIEWSPAQLEAFVSEMHKVLDFYLDESAKGSSIRITDFEETLQQKRNKLSHIWGCDAGRSRVAISTSGDIYPCSRFVNPYPDMVDKYCLGTIDSGIVNLSDRMDLMSNDMENRLKCAECDQRELCAGGCPAVNLHLMGNIFEPAPISCAITRMWNNLIRLAEQKRNGVNPPQKNVIA